MSDKVYPAALRAADELGRNQEDRESGAEIIHAAIDSHLKEIGYKEMMDLLTGSSLCEQCHIKREAHLRRIAEPSEGEEGK